MRTFSLSSVIIFSVTSQPHTRLAVTVAISFLFATFVPAGVPAPRAQVRQGIGTGGNCLVPGAGGTEDTSETREIDRTGFVYARVRYHPRPYFDYNPEVPWHHDYPDGDRMFPDALGRLTTTHTNKDAFQLVDIDSKELFEYPFIYMSEPGFLDLQPADIANLKEYFARGGFLLMDDFRGNAFDMSQWENMVSEMKKVFPKRRIEELTPKHQVFHSFFDLDPSDMLPPYRMDNSGDPKFLSISDDKGRIQVMIDFNNDISEYWQALDRSVCSIREAGRAVQLGVNYGIYAMSH